MVRKRGEDDKSHIEQLQNQLVFQIKLVHLREKMWARISVNSSNIEENRAQIIYPLRVHFCTFLRPPRSYISELATAVFTQVLFVLSNHSRGLTCLASVFHRKIVALKFVEMMLRKL